jgi:hypothetical protein
MLTEDEVKRIMLEAIAEFGGDEGTVTDENWRHIASKLRAEMRQRGATEAELELMARKMIDEFLLLPDATIDGVADASRAISDGFGFDTRFERERGGSTRINLTPKQMH